MTVNTKIILEKIKILSDPRALGLVVFGIIALLVTWSGVKVVQTNYELDKKISVERQQNAVDKLENENLKLKNAYFESEQYLELAARRQFGKAAPGEKLFIVPEDVALAQTADRPASKKTPEAIEQAKPRYQKNLEAWSEFLFR